MIRIARMHGVRPAGAMLIHLDDPARIAAFARRDPALHLYEIGDLDPAFWPRTRWWGWQVDGALQALAMLYDGGDHHSLLGFERTHPAALQALLEAIADGLPEPLYGHLSPGVEGALTARFEGTRRHRLHKMLLTAPAALEGIDAAGIRGLTVDDLPAMQALYARAYPDNWFDPRMLATGCYFGCFEGARLAAVAGVHVVSAAHRVAALGNIATAVAARGRGHARRVTAALCRALLPTCDAIGLNVRVENAAAIACYRRLGFETVADFEEWGFRRH